MGQKYKNMGQALFLSFSSAKLKGISISRQDRQARQGLNFYKLALFAY
jgi:hypothetical protein